MALSPPDPRGSGMDEQRAVTRSVPPNSMLDLAAATGHAPIETNQTAKLGAVAVGGQISNGELIHRLRLLRAEVQDLRTALGTIRNGEAPLEQYAEYISTTRDQISGLLADIRGDDEVRRIQNAWEMMAACPLIKDPANLAPDPQVQGQYLKMLDERCRTIILFAGHKTIPQRLFDWLEKLKPGDSIPFHAIFRDEVVDVEDRQAILDALSWVPDTFNHDEARNAAGNATAPRYGYYVDAESGVVYCYDRSSWGRYQALWLLGGVWLLMTIIAPLLGWLPQFNDARAASWSLFLGWMGVSFGIAFHVLVAARKRLKGPNGVLPSLFRLPNIINAKQTQLLVQLFFVFVGFLGLALIIGLPAAGTNAATVPSRDLSRFVFEAFLVGYTLDSFVEMFVTNLDRNAATLQGETAKRLHLRV